MAKKKKDINKIIHTTKYARASQPLFTPSGLRSRAVLTSPTSDEPPAKKNKKKKKTGRNRI
jgi:hypothetical protein